MKIAICIILHIQTKINKIPTVHVKTEGILLLFRGIINQYRQSDEI